MAEAIPTDLDPDQERFFAKLRRDLDAIKHSDEGIPKATSADGRAGIGGSATEEPPDGLWTGFAEAYQSEDGTYRVRTVEDGHTISVLNPHRPVEMSSYESFQPNPTQGGRPPHAFSEDGYPLSGINAILRSAFRFSAPSSPRARAFRQSLFEAVNVPGSVQEAVDQVCDDLHRQRNETLYGSHLPHSDYLQRLLRRTGLWIEESESALMQEIEDTEI